MRLRSSLINPACKVLSIFWQCNLPGISRSQFTSDVFIKVFVDYHILIIMDGKTGLLITSELNVCGEASGTRTSSLSPMKQWRNWRKESPSGSISTTRHPFISRWTTTYLIKWRNVEFWIFIFRVAFCFAKIRLFRVALSLHSFATLRNWLRQPLQSLPRYVKSNTRNRANAL